MSLSEIRESQNDVVTHWTARDELRAEVPHWRPIARRRRYREVRELIDKNESAAFQRRLTRVRWTLYGWVVLVVFSAYDMGAAWT